MTNYPKSTQKEIMATGGYKAALKAGMIKQSDSWYRQLIGGFVAELVLEDPEHMEMLISAGEVDCVMARRILEAV